MNIHIHGSENLSTSKLYYNASMPDFKQTLHYILHDILALIPKNMSRNAKQQKNCQHGYCMPTWLQNIKHWWVEPICQFIKKICHFSSVQLHLRSVQSKRAGNSVHFSSVYFVCFVCAFTQRTLAIVNLSYSKRLTQEQCTQMCDHDQEHVWSLQPSSAGRETAEASVQAEAQLPAETEPVELHGCHHRGLYVHAHPPNLHLSTAEMSTKLLFNT